MANQERSYRLLVVEDDSVDRAHYSRLLEQQGPGLCEIQQAVDGASGLAALRTHNPDCVLLDYSLPDMTGLDFLTAAAVDDELPCAVVFVTGNGNEAIAVQAMKRGAQDYLIKDKVNANSLWRSITTAVIQTELRQRLAVSLRELTAANAALEQEAATRRAAEADLRIAKDVAEQANQAKTRFVAMVTHELRTPLNGILGYAQILRLEGGLSNRQDTCVGAMMQAGYHLLEMIEGVLDFATIETGRMKLRLSAVPIRELSEQCIALITPMVTEHFLSLRTVYAYDAPTRIVADASRLRQVLLNLLGNAVKYTAEGGIELRILAGATPRRLRIEVADTGTGIDDADRDSLFQDFERLSAATSIQGAGLGLAIAARIVQLMDGAMGHAANPAGGSIFWLELPVGDITQLAAPPSDQLQADRPAVGKRVLLVDDIAMNRDVIGTFLRAAGHTVVLADCGLEAIRLAREETFDLILMDVRMPEMDGLEATGRIRALPAPHGGVPVVALTACAFSDHVAQCQAAGMNGHIAKPVDYKTLVKVIEEATGPASPVAAQHEPAAGFDRAILDQTLGFMPPQDGSRHLSALRERLVDILRLLDEPASPQEQADAGHALISAAGMFGFPSLSNVSRSFEEAVASASPQTEQIAEQLAAETRAALETLDSVVFDAGRRAA